MMTPKDQPIDPSAKPASSGGISQPDDEWEALRRKVQAAPPPIAADPAAGLEHAPEKPNRRRTRIPKIALVLVLLAIFASAAWYAVEHGQDLLHQLGASSAPAITPVTPPAAPPVADVKKEAGAAAVSTTTLHVKKGVKSVNVRSTASATAAVVAKLSADSAVQVVAENGAWAKIAFSADGKAMEGWIRRDLLQ